MAFKTPGSRFARTREEKIANAEKARSNMGKNRFSNINGSEWAPDEAKKYEITILPYVLTKEFHPDFIDVPIDVYDPECKEEKDVDMWYRRPYYIHRYDGRTYVCLAHSFGKPCPFCEEAKKYEYGTEESKTYGKKEAYMLYAVKVKGVDGIHIFNQKQSKFSEVFEETMKKDENKKYGAFYDPDDGFSFTAIFKGETSNFKGKSSVWYQCVHIDDFQERKPIPAEYIKKNIPKLDDCIKTMSYEAMATIIKGTAESFTNDAEDSHDTNDYPVEPDLMEAQNTLDVSDEFESDDKLPEKDVDELDAMFGDDSDKDDEFDGW